MTAQRRSRAISRLCALLALVPNALAAQAPASPSLATEVKVTAPESRFRAGAVHRLLLGSHYRDLWATPIQVPVLDLRTFAGGLEPRKAGGGMQTRSLRFKGADGREYVFRSLLKDPTQKLPPELRPTIAGRISRDQVSALHPAGPLVASALLEAAGVLHVKPTLVVLPSDPSLDAFGPEFSGAIGFLEERPTSDADSLPDGRRVIGTPKLLERLQSSANHRVDARAFLAARLMDIYLGDWDRHLDQWRWARPNGRNNALWQPIPRDRDYAFSKFDGLLLALARSQQPQWVGFGENYPAIFGLTWYGRALDRRFLTGLGWSTWDSTARALQARLTDAAIAAAAAELPPELYQVAGAELTRILVARRDRLHAAARDFYRLLAREPDVWTTDQNEQVRVERAGDGLEVTVNGPGDSTDVLYRRRFASGETREVRLYLQGGDDRVLLAGRGGGPLLRVVGGSGTDLVIDSSRGGRVRIYDMDGDTRSEGLRRHGVDRRAYRDFVPTDSTMWPPRDWGTTWRPLLWMNVEPEVGLFLGGGVVRYGFGFRRQPYATKTQLRAGYATGAAAMRAELRHQRWFGDGHTSAKLLLRASGIEVLRFYGFGNETERQGNDEFHRVPQQQYTASALLSFRVGRAGQLGFGPVLKYTDTDLEAGRFITLAPPPGVGRFGEVGMQAEYLLEGRDQPTWPRLGAALSLGGSVYPEVWDVASTFGEVHGEGTAYLSPRLPLRPTLALRFGAKRVWGPYPFHDAAFLGSSQVRGLRSGRYAGDASVYGGAEVRLPLFRPYIVVPGELGILGFTDVGRVYLDGESSNQWHTGLGGGIWFSFLQRSNTVSVSVARGDDRTTLYLRAGFGY